MKMRLLHLLLASSLLILPVVGNSQEEKDTTNAAATAATAAIGDRCCAALQRMLERGARPETLVRATMATGMSLADATVFAMDCGGEGNRAAIAVAGVGLANSLAQAQSVGDAVLAAVGQNGDVADAVREAVSMIASELPQPSIYVDEYTPTGTDVSPAS